MKTIAYPIGPAPAAAKVGLAGEPFPVRPESNYSVNMLQRTMPMPAPPEPVLAERIDYLVVERIAREMRNEYVADLIARAKTALARHFAQRMR